MDGLDADFILALQLQEQFDIEHESSGSLWPSSDSAQSNNNVSNNNYTSNNYKPTTVEPARGGGGGGGHGSRDPERPLSVVDESWEMLDPSPDVRAMFLTFNDRFFWGKLNGVEVKWSPRMTLCAGVCSYEGRGGLCSIRLSAPLLKLRPRRDLVETLLHEMIHALLFVTANNRDRDGHGPEFCKHMHRINADTGTKISIYHSFNDEVDAYRTHWWRCNGPCQTRKPYLGYVKRAMNRAPSALDNWWEDHRRSCGGAYVKVKEPEGYKKKGKAVAGSKDQKTPEVLQAPGNSKSSRPTKTPEVLQDPGNAKSSRPQTTGSGLQDIRSFIPFSGKGLTLGGGGGGGGNSSSPAFSPKKPLFSPSSQTSPQVPASPWNPPPSKVQGPPKKRSVGNTRYFTNVNGSPVRLPKPLPRRGTGTAGASSVPSSGIVGGRGGDPRSTTNGSIADIFNRRPSLKTSSSSSPSATVSKPPDETAAGGGAEVPSSHRNNASSTAAGGAVVPSSHRNNASSTESKSGGVSRKRPLRDSGGADLVLDDSGADLMSFLREALQGSSEESPTTSPAAKRSWVGPPSSAHAHAVVAKIPPSSSSSSSSSHQATNASFPSSNPSVPSTSGPRTVPASSSSSSSSSDGVSCPVCQVKVHESKINEHLDSCLSYF